MKIGYNNRESSFATIEFETSIFIGARLNNSRAVLFLDRKAILFIFYRALKSKHPIIPH